MDKSKMKKEAESVFERYPNADTVHVTSDGQSFFDKVYAQNHAAPQKGRKELDLETFRREQKGEELKNAKTLIAEINAAETVEAVTAIKTAETNAGKRKSVLEACDKKIVELNAAN